MIITIFWIEKKCGLKLSLEIMVGLHSLQAAMLVPLEFFHHLDTMKRIQQNNILR